MKLLPAIAGLFFLVSGSAFADAPAAIGATFDESAAFGANFGMAEFRLWLPSDSGVIRGALVLVPGSNLDGRAMADDPVWRTFAASQRLAIIACHFADKPHDQDFIEEYADASRGSGQALLEALERLARRAGHPELAGAPLLLWGMSAGGEFNYEFTAWKPERVIAFVVNKGGIYYTALTSRAARAVPGLLFVGGWDIEARTDTIRGLFAVNRRAGALWALTEEPAVGHVGGRSREMSLLFFEEVLPLRLGEPGSPLRALHAASGYLGDLRSKDYRPAGGDSPAGDSAAWLPTERAARAWRSIVTSAPFDDGRP
jgi:hypothetical protein